jgi:hypothetical protein
MEPGNLLKSFLPFSLSLSRARFVYLSLFLYAVHANSPSLPPYRILPNSRPPSILPSNSPTIPLPPHRRQGGLLSIFENTCLRTVPMLAMWHPHAHIERESDREGERQKTRERGRMGFFFSDNGALRPSPERRSAEGAGTHTLTRARKIHVPTSKSCRARLHAFFIRCMLPCAHFQASLHRTAHLGCQCSPCAKSRPRSLQAKKNGLASPPVGSMSPQSASACARRCLHYRHAWAPAHNQQAMLDHLASALSNKTITFAKMSQGGH